MATAGLSVIIYKQAGGVYNHWTVFVDGPSDKEKIIFNVMGSSTRYRYEERQPDARESVEDNEDILLCGVKVSDISAIRATAQGMTIHNEAPGYNCQDYVLELLDALEDEGIIDQKDKKYQKRKALVRSELEGFF